MISGYSYDLWDGNKVVGTYSSMFRLAGEKVVVPEVSIFKQKYGVKRKVIEVPIILRCVYDDGVELRYRFCLDVSKKSKRQISILKGEK